MRLDLKIPPAAWMRAMVVVAALGVLLMVCGALMSQAEGGKVATSLTTAQPDPGPYAPARGSDGDNPSAVLAAETSLENRVKSVLEQVAGVGKVDVSISMSSSPQYEYAVNVKKDQREITEKDEKGGTRLTTEENQDQQMVLLPATSQASSSPLVVKEVTPEIKGLLVVCDGAVDARVREELTQVLQTALDIPSYKIKVMPRNSEGR